VSQSKNSIICLVLFITGCMFTPAQKSLNNEVSVNVSGKDTSTDNVQEDFGYPDQDSLVPDSLMIDAGDLPDGDELTLQDEGEPPELSSDGDTGALAEDIPPGCGDNIKNGSEACDGTDFGAASCESLGYDGGVLKCSVICTFDANACYTCGDDKVNAPDESCDGTDLLGFTCINFGMNGGELGCTSACTWVLL